MSRLQIYKAAILVLISSGCGKEDNKTRLAPLPESPPPNSCKAMVNLGTWPDASSVNTWVYSCFEGFELTESGKKLYLADRCVEATKAPGFEFVDLKTTSCPVTEATSVCEGETFKIVAYQQDAAQFNLENFRKYCESKHGALKIIP